MPEHITQDRIEELTRKLLAGKNPSLMTQSLDLESFRIVLWEIFGYKLEDSLSNELYRKMQMAHEPPDMTDFAPVYVEAIYSLNKKIRRHRVQVEELEEKENLARVRKEELRRAPVPDKKQVSLI